MRFIKTDKKCVAFDSFLEQYGARLRNTGWAGLKSINEKQKDGSRVEVGKIMANQLFAFLHERQKGLCIYCLQAIQQKPWVDKEGFAHIEHIRKQEIYRELIFNITNLAVSCNGFDCKDARATERKNFCGHFKDGNYQTADFRENLFLHPHEVIDIEAVFSYKLDLANSTVLIEANAGLFWDKADYTAQYLNLNHKELQEMRKNQYTIVLEDISSGEISDINDYLSDEYEFLPSFYPMLKQFFLDKH